jgi:hypothetical protein
MLPDDFSFAQLPTGSHNYSLKELGMLGSKIEDIDRSLTTWISDLQLSTSTNEGFKETKILWQAPERAYQVKHDQLLRDDAGALKLPLISVERTGITKDPTRKGTFQANYYSDKKDGRSGRWTIARRIVPNKTQNFAIAAGTRTTLNSVDPQQFYPRRNYKVVIQSLSIPIPVYVNLDYKITLKTEYQQQMNDLLQPFMTRTGQINAFIMRRNGHLYEGFIQEGFTHNNNVSNLAEELRMFTSEITIRVLGYLVGEGESDDRPIVRLDENAVEYQFPSESEVPTGNFSLFKD